MKREDLFQAIGEVDDDLLDENVIVVKRRNIFPAIISVAACIAIVAGAVWIMPQKIPADNPETATTGIPMETLSETMMDYDAPANIETPVTTVADVPEIVISDTEISLVVENPTEFLTQAIPEAEIVPETIADEPEEDVFTIPPADFTPDMEDSLTEMEDFTQIHYPAMPAFLHGKYQAVGESGEVRYFWFDDDGSGRFEDAETGMGLGFTLDYLEVYNEDGTTDTIFHVGSVDDNTFAKIAYGEDGTLLVKWQDGAEEVFTYLGESNE